MSSMHEVARLRHESNRNSATNEPLGDEDADWIGVLGEVMFAYRFLGITDYRPPHTAPTKGYQFEFNGHTIKLMTSRTPGHLLVKKKARTRPPADIYVLARIDDRDYLTWLGWATREMVQAADVKRMNQTGHYTVPSHAIPRGELLEMHTLVGVIDARGYDAQDLVAAQESGESEDDAHDVEHQEGFGGLLD